MSLWEYLQGSQVADEPTIPLLMADPLTGHYATPAQDWYERLLQRFLNIGPRVGEQIGAGVEMLGDLPPKSVIPKERKPLHPTTRGVNPEWASDAIKWLGSNVGGLVGIGTAPVGGPVTALLENPISDQLQLEAGLSKNQADMAAMAATGLIPLGAAGKLSKLKRVKSGESKGQYVGAPQGLDSPQKLAAMQRDYQELVELGMAGRRFYEDSSNFFLDLTGGDVVAATQLAKAYASTSQGASLDPNMGWAIKGHYQGLLGDDINTGRFPKSNRAVLPDVYAGADPDLGPKRGPFAQNLQSAWDDRLAENPVNDIWQGRAFGFKHEPTVKYPEGEPWGQGFSETQHDFMNRVTKERLTPRFNQQQLGGFDDWNNLRTQAAAWSGARQRAGEIGPEDQGIHYGDLAKKYTGTLTRETMPGSTTGHLQELLSRPELRMEYHKEMMKILVDPKSGKDRIARAFHLLTPGNPKLARGFYVNPKGEVELNPAYHVPFLAGRDIEKSQFGSDVPGVDPATKALVGAAESVYSQLTAQNAYGWNYVMGLDKMSQPHATSAAIDIGRQLNDNELLLLYKKLQKEFDPDDFAPIPHDAGVTILYFGEPKSRKVNKKGSHIGSQFIDKTGKIITKFAEEIDAKGAQVSYAKADTGFAENNWSTERYGQSFVQDADIRGRPSLLSAYDDVVPEIAAKINVLERRFAKENNLTINKDIHKMREALAQGGMSGLEKLIKTGTLPVALVATFMYELRFGTPEPEKT
tara:strand:- start:275 stop:2527 length:2253 start_codon:yes stop_codon:yes gene_type:complete